MLPSSKLKRLILSCNSSIAISRSEQYFVLFCMNVCSTKATAQAHNVFSQTSKTINLLLIIVKTFSRHFNIEDPIQENINSKDQAHIYLSFRTG